MKWISHIYSVWKVQKVWQNNSALFARAIHLKPKNLTYPNSWLVVVDVFFVCLCVCSSLCLCGKHYMVIRSWCQSIKVIMLISLCLFHYAYCQFIDVTILKSLCWCHSVNGTLLMKKYVLKQHLYCKRWLMHEVCG